MKELDKIVSNYLANFDHKYLITDEHKNYTKKEIIFKVKEYQKILHKLWKNSKNRGIAILLPRDVEYICLIFATWMSKGYYLPLSLDAPKKNTLYQLKDAEVNILVEKKKNKICFTSFKTKKNNKLIKNNYKKIAYIIFTSGSTGKKKGVCIPNIGLCSYINSITKIFSLKKKPKSLIISGELTFDITIADLVFAFVYGSQIILTNKSQNFIGLVSMIKKNNVESIYLVPSALNKFLEFCKKIGLNNLKSIKQINLGGERFDDELLSKIKKYLKKVKVYNFYGPTEFTVNSMYHEVDMNKKYNEIPIGKPLNGIKAMIIKKELYLSGNQIMLGYVNYKNSFKKINNTNYYATGDIVRFNKNKEFIFESRTKDYIKLDGYRINLLRIESIIYKYLLISIKLTIYKNKIIMFVEKNVKRKKLLTNKINKIFSLYLDKYEHPKAILYKEKFPLLDSGKIDVKKLLVKVKI